MAAAASVSEGFHDCRDTFARTIEALADSDQRIVAVVSDSVGSSKLNGFLKKFPDRVVNVGIAEQTLVAVGAGLANGGRVPFVSAASCFLTGRALEQVKADIAYAWSVRTIWGIDGTGARQQAVSGDNVFANLSWASPIGALTGFGYWVDHDEAVVQGYRLSSRTFGVRLAGVRALGKAKLAYQLSHARQSDLRRNPNDYEAAYWLADVSIDLNGPKLGVGYEVLGADNGVALTSFQTPLGTNFNFQGWADKFLVTPPDGVRDLYATAGWSWKAVGPLKAVTLQAAYHDYRSDRAHRAYGDEIDLLASGKLGKVTGSARYARYRAGGFATDTDKFWLQLDWIL